MAEREDDEVMIGRSYTRARRYPLVIGRWPGSQTRLLGGPYSLPQLIVMVGGFVLLVLARESWARFGLLLNVLIVVGVPFAAGMAVRRLHVQGRPPWSVAASVLRLLVAPRGGRLAGRVLPRARARRVGGVYTYTLRGRGSAARRPVSETVLSPARERLAACRNGVR